MKGIKVIAGFVVAVLAAIVLGLFETFGTPVGRRLLALGALLGGVLVLALKLGAHPR